MTQTSTSSENFDTSSNATLDTTFSTASGCSFNESCDAYLDAHWDEILDDLRRLVRIPSFDQSAQAAEGAPYGPGPRAALDEALNIAARMGFETQNCEGHIGFADWPGASKTQLGIICHTDVVPAGPGWNFEPYELSECDGYLIGRGVSDDKGPLVICLHALNFLKQRDARFPYTVRFLFGSNEEVGMGDVLYYRAHYDDPAFLFTPDAKFPVCHGEKGIYQARASRTLSAPGAIASISAGETINAVPGEAQAVLRASAQTPLVTHGRNAHAATPHLGENAITKLCHELLETPKLSQEERALLELSEKMSSCTDGSLFGLACSDEDFDALTMCCGMLHLDEGTYTQSIDIRYPTTIDADTITRTLKEALGAYGFSLEVLHCKEPFLIDANAPTITALRKAYCDVTGVDVEPFTMGGGTYAREFSRAASFGMEPLAWSHPDWVGGMHGPNEGINIAEYKQAFKIYVRAIAELMTCDLESS